MKIHVIGKQISVYEETKNLIEQKLSKLDRYFDGDSSAVATLSKIKEQSILEVTIKASSTLFRSEVSSETFRDALDKSIDNIERQIRKNKTRLQKRFRPDAFTALDIADPYEEDFEEDTQFVVKTKKFEFSPMSTEEAILQMNLLGHTFFVFNDDKTDQTCVVYKRKDGDYGLIVPE